MGRQSPDKNQFSTNLKHPTFTFEVNAFHTGTLTGIGFLNNKKVIGEVLKTPSASAKINQGVDVSSS